MTKTILITGSTDGIGLETAKALAGLGHTILLHGRSDAKLADAKAALSRISGAVVIEAYRADLSQISDVDALASAVTEKHAKLDVLINNAGVFKVPSPRTADGLDLRFVVNTVAPYLLTKRFLPRMSSGDRVINLSSAAQAPVNLDALAGKAPLDDSQAYAQSKLALTMWSFHLAQSLGDNGPAIIAVNPASFLASKMVKDAYGVEGNDLRVGADILVRAALNDDFAGASGRYFDNDRGQFAPPHPDALDPGKNEQLVQAIEALLAELSG
ncbi:MAG: SDR family NAD(P)-dependent oxidoreductase [Geminicoccaceae bacterium]